MSQHDYNIANADGATVRADMNALFQAIAEQNGGATAPSTTFPGMYWFDTANNLLKLRNIANTAWVTVASFSGTTWIPYYQGTPLGAASTKGAAGAVGDVVLWASDGGSPESAIYPAGDGSQLTNLAVNAASQAEMEAASATDKAVTPGRQHLHPSAAKFWGLIFHNSGTPTISADYNVDSLTDNGTGDVTVNVDTDFSADTWAPIATGGLNSAGTFNTFATIRDRTAGSVRVVFSGADNNLYDVVSAGVAGFGDQA